jgi:HD-GYP domain-containing protein (c-di-GMP phosphodiesterase class II)
VRQKPGKGGKEVHVLRVIVRQARPGMTLARSIVNPKQPDLVLLTAGFLLDAPTIARLHELGVYDLWINYPGLDFLDDLYSPQLTSQQQKLCETLKTSFVGQLQRGGAADPRLPIHEFRATVEELVQTILNSAATLPFMSMLSGVDDSLLRHSSEVCVLGVMLGLRLDSYLVEQRRRVSSYHAKDVVNLGLGCMLHDVGELQLPADQRESKYPFAFDEHASLEWRRHTELGYAAVRGQLEPSAATIVLNHHQHFDGSGFPAAGAAEAPQSGSAIHVFSRIAMAADTFQHLLHQGGIPQPAVCALWQMQQHPIRRWFDPVVLATLLAVVPPFIPGMVVTLSDGRVAIVSKVHEDAPCYPEVQVLCGINLMSETNLTEQRELIDLATTPDVHIKAVDGFQVADFLYGPRHIAVKPAYQRPETLIALGS